jgi:hypothetical protein
MKNAPSNWSLLDPATRWIRNTLARHADEAALADSGEAARIASDLNLSVAELHRLCARDGESPRPLQQRLSQLHLDKNKIKAAHPGVVRDLERTCALCDCEAECRADLQRNPESVVWTAYCPNAFTLQELQQEAAAD